MTSVTPSLESQPMMRETSGTPATGSAGLARTLVSGARRVAEPGPAR